MLWLRPKHVLNQIFNPGLPWGDEVDTVDDEEQENNALAETQAVIKAKALEHEAVKLAESGNVDASIALFDQAVAEAPEWPSTYNNRAQALRLKGDEEGALADLDKALQLSEGKGTVACQAYTQRGLLRTKQGDEEGAKSDLGHASELGGGFAKQLLTSMNPYAALCNQMLGDVMQKLRNGDVA